MRLAVLADIHSNFTALRAVLADAQQHGIAQFVIAGDHINGGPRPTETLRVLRSLDAWLIRGNTDDYLLSLQNGDCPDNWRTSPSWHPLRFVYGQLKLEDLKFLRELPDQTLVAPPGTDPIRVVHGSLNSPFEHLLPVDDPYTVDVFRRAGILPPGEKRMLLRQSLDQIKEAVLVCGHSHIAWQWRQNGQLGLNPGSVGAPINGDPRAQYAILTWTAGRWEAELRAIEYDRVLERRAFEQSGFLEGDTAMARAFLLVMETGKNVSGKLGMHAYALASAAGYEYDSMPDAVWDQAVASFDWEAAVTSD